MKTIMWGAETVSMSAWHWKVTATFSGVNLTFIPLCALKVRLNGQQKNVQLILQHCCKTSWIATWCVLPPTSSNLSCNKPGVFDTRGLSPFIDPTVMPCWWAETAVHGCHCPGDMTVRLREVLARLWVGVCVPLALGLPCFNNLVWTRVVKRATSLFKSGVLRQQVARCCYPLF